MDAELEMVGIVALTSRRVMGLNGSLPWHSPSDLKLFNAYTTGHAIIMGRKTFDSIGRALPNRRNVVLTRNASWKPPVGVECVNSVEAACQLEVASSKVFIIGGAEIYRAFLPRMSSLLVSWIFKDYPGDTYFPKFCNEFPKYKVVEKFEEFELRKYTRQ